MKLLKNLTILLCFLSLIAFISCGAEDKTGGVGNDGGAGNGDGADSVPTFTGDPATDLEDGYYKGTLYYKIHSISDDFQYPETTKEQFVEELKKEKAFCLKIANNKLKWGENELEVEYEGTIEKEAEKSGSEYGATIEDGQNNEQVSYKDRKTIKFTISSDGNTISITYIEGQSADGQVDGEDEDGNETYVYVKYSYYATYEGTLTKYTPTPTPIPTPTTGN